MGKRSEYDTGQLPPGSDFGEDLPNRGQSLNTGFGASKADLKRGHTAVPEPDSSLGSGLDRYSEPEGGFLRRTPFSVER